MKNIFLILFIASNITAMQAPNCFYAHQKYLAMITTCKHTWHYTWINKDEVNKRQECVEIIFNQFKKECQEESAQKETAK